MSSTQTLVDQMRRTQAERPDLEIKAAAGGTPRSLRETLSAFNNDHGGTILLGLTDPVDGTLPVEGFNASSIADGVAGMASNDLIPPVIADITIDTIDNGHRIVRVDVPEGEYSAKPYYVHAQGQYAGSYTRGGAGDGDRRMTSYEVDRLLENRAAPRHDQAPIMDADLSSLDPQAVSSYAARLRERHPRIYSGRTDEEILRQSKATISTANGDVPTLAGLLALGFHPQYFFPQLTISVVVLPEDSIGAVGAEGIRFLDSKTCIGSIPVMIEDATNVLLRNMRKATVVPSEGLWSTGREDRYEYPLDVVRELLANAVLHRDYSPAARGSQIQVELHPNRLIVRSPGGLYGPVLEGDLGAPGISSSRNELLASLLSDVPLPGTNLTVVENRGSGIPRVFNALQTRGMEPPRFNITLERMQVTVPHNALLTEEISEWLKSLRQEGLTVTQELTLAAAHSGMDVTNALLQGWGLHSSQASAELSDLVSRGVLIRKGGRRWARYSLPDPLLHHTHSVPIPAPDTPTTKVQIKRMARRSQILQLLTEKQELSSSTLLNNIAVSRQTLLNDLNALISEGLVIATAPGKNPNRTYRLNKSPDTPTSEPPSKGNS